MPNSLKWVLVAGAVVIAVVLILGIFFVGLLAAGSLRGPVAAGGPSRGMMGWGMMGGQGGGSLVGAAGGSCGGLGAAGTACSGLGVSANAPAGQVLSLDQARQAVERYVAAYNNPDLYVDEVMEFELNFYGLVKERSTGIGAFEVLVNKQTGAVSPEPGPNMMWNARYGMMGGRGMMGGGMMGGYSRGSGTMRVTPAEAARIGQDWLDRNLPGVQAHADDVDAFYGYYTLHLWKDGRLYGMLSVSGDAGQVWYHTWHGAFVAVLEGEGS